MTPTQRRHIKAHMYFRYCPSMYLSMAASAMLYMYSQKPLISPSMPTIFPPCFSLLECAKTLNMPSQDASTVRQASSGMLKWAAPALPISVRTRPGLIENAFSQASSLLMRTMYQFSAAFEGP